MEQNGGTALSALSSLPPEIWRVVAEQIQGPKNLLALVRVCRAFRDVFQPFLNSRFVIELNSHAPSDWEQRALRAGLSFTKEFEVDVFEFTTLNYDVTLNDSYALYVAKLLKAMPNLQSFRWLDMAFLTGYDPSLMLRNEELVKTLKSLPSLRNLSLQFAGQYLDDEVTALKCYTHLKGFKCLTSLELYQFYGEETQLINDIASVLSDCPGLKKLGLGMATDCECLSSPEYINISGDCDFLEKLCIRYGARSSPLALETLRLGQGMFLYESSSAGVGNFLAKLVNIKGIRTLHIFNGLVHDGDEWEEERPMEIHWGLLEDCTSLNQLSVSRIEKDVVAWVNTSGNSIQEFIVTDHYGMYDDELDNFDALRIPHLSMLYTCEVAVPIIDHEDAWSDTDSDSSDTDMEISDSANSPKLSRTIITVLDRLYDRGAHLKKLGLAIDLRDAQYFHFATHLPNLHNLTYLRLHSKSGVSGHFPPRTTSLWPNINRPKDIAIRYVKLMRSKCPSLQYVQMQRWAWQIMAPLAGMPVRVENCDHEVELRELEYEEILAIDLFAMDQFVTQSGLIGPEEYHKEMSEEEEMRMERIAAAIEARMAAGEMAFEFDRAELEIY